MSAPQEVTNTRGGPDMSVNGGRSVNNYFTFNGANFTHFGQTTGVNMPPPDAVQEIRIQTDNFTAEYGNNSGSQVSVTSKAGTNQLHGSLWEFLRNDKLNARSVFQTRRAQTRQNQFGGAGGGPIRRDRLRIRLLSAPGGPARDGVLADQSAVSRAARGRFHGVRHPESE